MFRWILGFVALGVLAGCGELDSAESPTAAPPATSTDSTSEDIVTVVIDGEPGDSASTPAREDCSKAPARTLPPVSPATNRTLEPGCWAADLELPEGECLTAHAHLAKAMNSCWSNGGEAVQVALWNTCATGYRAAAIACCPALANATPPPETLPEPIGSDGPPSACGVCSGASGTSSQRTTCLGETSINDDVVGIVEAAVERGEEIHGFNFADRCGDGGFATSGYDSCSVGTRFE